ncbi:hypothetical protein M404DRAFT_31062 [Pisolithus tinctorius Marx 270]|uniref:Reverse transcriptase/retrotransposon-derived protein RNase H-like domain-containing protein n=1 Tax=Pisolithus tinctorius Marx 270 TaxID=870435 RepID=A0A0C3NTE2_PISTI|nr:hypothetical protein M404DRAFT_31062 [Pisolithus tinctorius Marx 270]
MRELSLPLKLEKCHFDLTEVEYLGMIMKENTVAMDPVKVQGIADWPVPKKVKDVRSFLGFANFYRRFIPYYSDIAQPLINLTQKTIAWEWSKKCQNAFELLKRIFMAQPTLQMPNVSWPFTIMTDMSKYAMGGILLQEDSNGQWQPCAYLSQSFNPAEQNYDIYDRELLGVFTDHKNLTYFKSLQNLNCCQAHWLLDLADFDLQLEHVPGKDLAAPDALS